MTNTPMTFEAFAIEHGMSILKVGEAYSDDDTNYAHWVWSKCQAQQAQTIAELVEALEDARQTIRAWHGPMEWNIYDTQSPEMKRLNGAIAKVKGK